MYLQHHGIKGQKWGVRRFQNEDGSYTNLGKQRRQQTNVFYKGQKAKLDDEHMHNRDMSWLGNRKDVMKNYHPVKDDLIFKKGSEFQRVTRSEKENLNKRVYVTQEIGDYDNDYFHFDEKGNAVKTYVKTYAIDKDIKIAGFKTVNKVLESIGEKPLEYIHTYGSDNGSADYFMEKTKKDKKVSKAINEYLDKNGYAGLIDPVDTSSFSNSAYIITDNVLKEIGSYVSHGQWLDD